MLQAGRHTADTLKEGRTCRPEATGGGGVNMSDDERIDPKGQELTDEDVEGVVGGTYVPGAYSAPKTGGIVEPS